MATTTTTTALVITAFFSAALYCVLELGVLLAATCRRCHGLYFWSLFAASCGVVLYAVGFLLRDLGLVDVFDGNGRGRAVFILYVLLIAVGWCAMVTGQSLVLYSRLPLLWARSSSPADAERRILMLRVGLAAILLDALFGHGATIGLLCARSLSATPERLAGPYDVVNIVQANIFFTQEVVLAGIYIVEAFKMLRRRDPAGSEDLGRDWRRHMQWRLMLANVVSVLLSMAALVLVFTQYHVEQAMFRALAYAIKLKLDLLALDHLDEVTAVGRDDAPGGCDKRGSRCVSQMRTFYIEDDEDTATIRPATSATTVHKEDMLAYEFSVSGGAAAGGAALPNPAGDDAISVVKSTEVSHRRRLSFLDMRRRASGASGVESVGLVSQRSTVW